MFVVTAIGDGIVWQFIMESNMRKLILNILAVAVTAMTIFSCKDVRNGEVYRLLTDVDSYIESRPDSALAVLEGIEKSELTSKELEAKYALLLSQALDKNYIDLQSDSIIAPAVRYYERYGSADEKLKMYYYSGRIKQNAGDNEGAMEMFVKGEEYAERCADKVAAGRLFNAKLVVNQDIFNYPQAIIDARNAAEAYQEAGYMSGYFLMINDLAILYQLEPDEAKHKEYMDILKANWNLLSERHRSHYYTILLNPYSNSDDLENLIREYTTEIKDSSLIIWPGIAEAYIRLNDPKSALEALEYSLIYNNDGKDAAYYLTLSDAYEQMGRSTEAFSAYKKYVEIIDETDVAIFENDTKFIEERHQKEIQLLESERNTERITLISIIAILCAFIIIYFIRRQLRIRTAEKKQLEIEKKRYEQLYADAIAERDALTKMIEDSSVKDETKAVIRERLEVLNKVIISHITDTSSANKKAFQELEALISDRDSFIESTRLTIEGNNPGFISALREAGLTDEEINICCLYVIGLKGKDIKTYTNQSRLYIQSAEIRHKLGLTENDTNLSIYLRNMCENEVC